MVADKLVVFHVKARATLESEAAAADEKAFCCKGVNVQLDAW